MAKKRLTKYEHGIAKDALGDLVALKLGITSAKLDRDGRLTLTFSDTCFTTFQLGDGAMPNSIVIYPAPKT